ncbi:hypothetical protein HN51_009551 [Arachis hypogaea]|nr:LRR receptor-like serine/threonine-protein kinase [Arachis hypogaea]
MSAMTMTNPTCFKILMKSILIMCFMLQVVDLVCSKENAKCIESEREALLQFKAAMMDDFGVLSSWKEKSNCCQWKGVHCSRLTGHVQRLDLSSEAEYIELRGKIPESLLELQHLRYLYFTGIHSQDNHIPEFFGSLRNLRYLDLSHCGFGGKIPTQFGSLSHLRYLNLQANLLEGSIPFQLGNLSKLQYLNLGVNDLEGTIPSQIGNLSSLQELYLFNFGTLKNGDGGGQWLSKLNSLTHLDLSHVLNLENSHYLFQMVANLSNLRQLSLTNCNFSDHSISSFYPFKFKSSNSLSVFDLSLNHFTSSMIFHWVSNVTSNLIELNLSDNNLFEDHVSNNFCMAMNSLENLDLRDNKLKGSDMKLLSSICTLRSLYLSQNNFTEDLASILHNLSAGCMRDSLEELDLGNNQITGSLPDLSIFPFLKQLDLSLNRLSGKIAEHITLPSQLESFSVSVNSLEGVVPNSFGNTCTLRSLYFSMNNLSKELSLIIHHLSGCARNSLQELHLDDNQIYGTLPDLSIFPSLKKLSLDANMLNGRIPQNIQFPPQLESLSMGSTSLEGVITNHHFANMSKLKVLDLSDNSLFLTFSNNWVPSFQLREIYLRNCKLGPSFPKWLQTQDNLLSLDISNAGISDVVPHWFWNLPSWKLESMNISYNNLTGTIPNFPVRFSEYPSISLATNQFEGPIPPFLQRAISLDLSDNKFSDFDLFACANGIVEQLGKLDFSDNRLSGKIPNCWSKFKSLGYIDLSNNNLSGEVPTSIGSALQLQVLMLRNNHLTGKLPFSLRSCTKLVMLDAGENELSGVIPSWIGGDLQQLQMLILRRNRFYGGLPLSLCHLANIHLLDISSNNLKGQIPTCFKNFTAMIKGMVSAMPYDDHTYFVNNTLQGASDFLMAEGEQYDLITLLMWKGVERMLKNDKLLLKGIDLSSNQLSGEIPTELVSLVELVTLNLSRNNLSGEIPLKIGNLASLEFLDLSRNNLSGLIPSSLTQINRLSMLDLSHNNLSGEIPTSTQLQSFNASSYEENQDLCGPPLEKMCFKGKSRQTSSAKTKEDDHDPFYQAFYMSMGLGFFVGFWSIFGTILFNRFWRHAYFKFLNKLTNKVMSRW